MNPTPAYWKRLFKTDSQKYQLFLDCRDADNPIIGCYEDTIQGLQLAQKRLSEFLIDSLMTDGDGNDPDEIIDNNGIRRIPVNSIIDNKSPDEGYYYSAEDCMTDDKEIKKLYKINARKRDEKEEELQKELDQRYEEQRQREERKKKRKHRVHFAAQLKKGKRINQ